LKKEFINIDLKLVGSLCNLNCSYCYEHDLYGNINTGKIFYNDIIAYVNQLEKNYDFISITLHGGEPLLYPKDDMRNLLSYFKNKKNIYIGIQTNGVLIDQEWIDIFKNYSPDFLFSISLDSKESILRGFNTNKLFNIFKLIKKNKLQIGILSVISKDNVDTEPYKKFIDMLINDFKIDFLSINKIRLNKSNRIDANISYILELEYTNFLIDIFQYWVDNKIYEKLKINPFLDIFKNKNSCSYSNDVGKCANFITIYPPFKFKGCDQKIGQSQNLKDCLSCEIFDFCGSGCHYEIKDDTFCEARFLFFQFIKEYKVL